MGRALALSAWRDTGVGRPIGRSWEDACALATASSVRRWWLIACGCVDATATGEAAPWRFQDRGCTAGSAEHGAPRRLIHRAARAHSLPGGGAGGRGSLAFAVARGRFRSSQTDRE